MLFILVPLIIMYIIFDINYFVRSFFVRITSIVQRKYTLDEVTTSYGIGTFLDCDVSFRYVRLARLIRELDFARYHLYNRTGIYNECENRLEIKFLQGSTLTLSVAPVPLFTIYKINTKLVYWDDKSMFFEHEVVTLNDGKVRGFFISRQHTIGKHGDSTGMLLKGLPGAEQRPDCPDCIKKWLRSMQISSQKMRLKQ